MFNRRKKLRKNKSEQLLNAFFEAEYEWKNMRSILDNSLEYEVASDQFLQLLEARYIFLLKEAKERNINALLY